MRRRNLHRKPAALKILALTLMTVVALLLTLFDRAEATVLSPPHDFSCDTCHVAHNTLGYSGYNNICMTCHRGGEPRTGTMSFAPGDAADPFGRYTSQVANRFQISHRWDGDDINPLAGAVPPVLGPMTSVRAKTANALACIRCHNPHSQDNRPFLRVANDTDQMCLDCHRSRNTSNHASGSHPIGINYQQRASANPSGLNAVPINTNPANPTSAMKFPGGMVLCSSCHGVHATDSNSSTFDGFSSLPYLKYSDGNLLRTDLRAATADGINICTNCHAGKVAHNGRGQNIQCADCHGAHVDSGDGSTPNVWLVKRDMGQGRGKALFTSTTVKNYMSADGSGVCQACHAVPTGTGFQFHLTETNATCNNCHAHGTGRSSFSVDTSKACDACHGYPPVANIAGPGGYAAGYNSAASFTDESNSGHSSHAASPYQNACVNCHQGNSHQSGTFQDVFIYTTGSVAATGGLAPVYDKALQSCTAVYCHSNANPRGGVNIVVTTPSWKGGKGKIIGTAGECGACHSAAGAPLPTWSVSHSRHVNGYAANPNFTCATCHARTASGNAAIFDNISARSLHTNGQVDVVFKTFGSGGIWNQGSATCDNLYCHSNVQGSAGAGPPGSFSAALTWNGAAMNCGSCHAAMVKMGNISTATGSHMRHTQAYSYDCATCHGAGYSAVGSTVPVATHVDGVITMALTGIAATNGAKPAYYQGNNTPGDGYAKCSNLYCHSSVQGNGGAGAAISYAAPVWGSTPLPCGSCHANMATSAAATGSHVQHAQLAGYSCITCHNGAGKDPNPPFAATARHANGTIEISFSGNAVGTVYSKGGAVAPGTGYGSCSAGKCHGSAAVIWGSSLWSPTDLCGKCHSSSASGVVGADTPFYSTSYPVKVTSNTDAKVGAHTAHLTVPGILSTVFVCADCHGPVSLASATHMNGATDFVWSPLAQSNGATPVYDPATGVCSNVYCHGAAMPGGDASGVNRAPVWNRPFMPMTLTAAACGTCHGFPPSSVTGHPTVTIPAGFPATAAIGGTCSCHGNINPAGNSYDTIFVDKTLHINGAVEVSAASACDSCHGYPPAQPGFAGAQNAWLNAKTENYPGGGGAHTINNHVSMTATSSQGFTPCLACHKPADHAMSPTVFLPSLNIRVTVHDGVRYEASVQARYTSNRLNGVQHQPGTCSNISCHFGATPAWDQH
jgi:predicted CxxxxCH...CXXCH cytochrome family protein